ncbi:MAG: hypothetical protein AB8C46_00645 [Burkholderiaceae bacterium]
MRLAVRFTDPRQTLMLGLAMIIALACLFTPTPGSAQSDASSEQPLATEQVRALFLWAAHLTRRSLPDNLTLPVLVPMPVEQINALVCPQSPNRCRPVAAAYGITHRNIIYRESLNLSRVIDRSYLLHEAVHFLQHLEQREAINASCRQIRANERQAYRAQAAFLRAHQIYHPVGLELARVRCPSDNLQITRRSEY